MEESSDKGNVRIAVIDDSDFSRKAIINILESEGYTVAGEANSAQKALELLGAGLANIFIIDIVMPQISGLDLARQISEFRQEETIYIIMMSSLTSENIVIESISSGAVDFLAKPFEKDDLIKSVEKIVRQMASSQEL